MAEGRVGGRVLGALLLAAGLLGACGADDGSDSAPASSIAASSSEDSGASEPIVLADRGPVGPGEYRWEVFEPTIDFTLARDGWWYGLPQQGFAGVNRYPSEPDLAVLVFRPTAVYEADGITATDPPEDLAAWLQAHPLLTTGPAEATQLDGRKAVRFDVTVTASNRPCDLGDGVKVPCAVLAPIPNNSDARSGVGERSRVWVLDLDGPTMISVTATADRFDEFVEEGQAIVESMRFG
jgi:hypothetical protein